jgi:hypothetical protein
VLRGLLDVGPWTELFIEDRPEVMDDPKRPGGVVLVYRDNPFKDLDPARGYIMPGRRRSTLRSPTMRSSR